MNLYDSFILAISIKYRFFFTSLPPYGSCTGERVMYVSVVVLQC